MFGWFTKDLDSILNLFWKVHDKLEALAQKEKTTMLAKKDDIVRLEKEVGDHAKTIGKAISVQQNIKKLLGQ